MSCCVRSLKAQGTMWWILLVFWWSVNWIVMESSLRLEISISHYSIFKWYVPPSKLTGVRVQAEATSAVACLNSVWYSAIFSFVWISSHDVQNHKPVNEDTNQTSSRKCTWGFQRYFITDTDVTLTLQADPPWRWPQMESWRLARCRFRLSRTLGRWPNSSVSERYPLPGLWLAPRGKGRVWTHGLTSAPGWGLRLTGQGWGSQEFQARSARWNSAAHCWVHCHPIKQKERIDKLDRKWIDYSPSTFLLQKI